MSNQDKLIGNYRLLHLLNKGHYTDVWLGEHIDLKKKVAIKILIPQEIRDSNERPCTRKRFHREACILAQLSHPHIVQVFDYGEEYRLPYFVMEYAPYGSLARRHRLGERLPLSTVRSYTSQVGRAIHYIHTQGLIHRDIKPQNMFLRTRNLVLLGDFGLAIPIHSSFYSHMIWQFGGTSAYMAPEQEQGEPCPASDQYAFATIVFEWLTGYSPFYGTAEQIARQRKKLSPPSTRAVVPDIPAAVNRVVLTALQKTPGHRFKTMLDFTLAFEEACKRAIVRLPYDASASHLHRMVASRDESASRQSAVLRQQRSGGSAQQPVLADRGDVLVAPAPRPVPLRHRQIKEEAWNPLLTSDREEKNVFLSSRFQALWSMMRKAWQRIVDFLPSGW